MGVRDFTDSEGRAWRVWDTFPQMGQLLRPGFANGWLTFESDLGRYRLASVMRGWENFSSAKLEALCRSARAGQEKRATSSDEDHRATP